MPIRKKLSNPQINDWQMDKARLYTELQGLDDAVAKEFSELVYEKDVSIKTPKDLSAMGVILLTIIVPAIGSGLSQAIGEDIWNVLKNIARKIGQLKRSNRKTSSAFKIRVKDRNNGRTIFFEIDANASFQLETEVDKIKITLPEIGKTMNSKNLSTLRIEIKDSNWKSGKGKKQDGTTEIVLFDE